MILRGVVLMFVFFLIEWYAFQVIRTLTQNKWALGLYWASVVLIFGNSFWHFFTLDRSVGYSHAISLSIGFFISLFAFQLVLVLFLLLEDLVRIPQGLFQYLKSKTTENNTFLPNRRKFISQIALGLGAIPLASLLYGMFKGKYNYKVLSYTLEYEDLPEAFEGFTITQISDLHCGSFDNPEKVAYGVELINNQKSDLLLFTGDLVNNRSEEARPWIGLFSKIEASYGKYSILGNHDYGDYAQWDSEQAKDKNMKDLFEIHKEMGFDLLLNENRILKKGEDEISLIGVENWGTGRFKKAGDLKKSVENIDSKDFKILMTHDPSHWEAEVLPHPFPFQLTLSGHTHGMQFGIEIPGWIKWSPSKWRYKQWAGIYEKQKQRLNVNRGFGFLAYPGRIGIWPEITVITLRKKNVLI